MENRFKITEDNFGKQRRIKLEDTETNDFVTILPDSGAMLLAYQLSFQNKSINILDSYKTEEELKESLATSYMGSNLFPFPNRVDSGIYEHNNTKYQLHINFPNEDNAIHGLVWDKIFKVADTKVDNSKAVITLEYTSEGNLKGYPFKFTYSITYELTADNGLKITNSATNRDSQSVPVGFGYHPYFKLDQKVDELLLEIPSKAILEVDDKRIPTKKTKPYSEFATKKTIGDSEFDNCFTIPEDVSVAKVNIYTSDLKEGIEIWQETGAQKLNYVQLYTPPHRNSIAVEPMSCFANALNNKVGLIDLEPGKTSKVIWGIKKK